MKRKRLCSLVCAVILSLSFLCACNDGGSSGAVLRIAGGAPSGGYYLQSTPIALLWEKLDSVSICKVEATIGAYENLNLLSRGEADAGLADMYAAYCASDGVDPFTSPLSGFSVLAYAAPLTIHFIVRASSDIYSVSDLKGHSLATGTPGSATEAEVRTLLELLDISYKDLSRVDRIGVGASLTELQDGKVDAVAALLMSPSSSITETMLSTDIRLLSFTADELVALAGSASWLQPTVIPAGTYKGLDEDVNALCVPCALWVRSELPYDLVYDMTRTLYENIDQLKEINVSYNGWTLLPQDGSDKWLHAAARDFYDTLGR